MIKKTASIVVVAGTLLTFAGKANAQASEYLVMGDYLFPGQGIVGSQCHFHLDMQTDGNLVTYAGAGERNGWWASGTHGRGGYATLQTDGNLVIYNWNDAPVWATNTYGGDELDQQDDGNLVLYTGQGSGSVLWASGRSGGGVHSNIAQPIAVAQPLGTEEVGGHTDTESLAIEPRPDAAACVMEDRLTRLLPNVIDTDGAYRVITPNQPRASWCGYFCAQDARCRAFNYVGGQCQLMTSASGAASAPGAETGYILIGPACYCR